MPTPELMQPDWPAPTRVKAYISTRRGGVSVSPYGSLNLGDHVGDDLELVTRNREAFAHACGLNNGDICWLKQIHSTRVVDVGQRVAPFYLEQADASTTRHANVGCVIMTADCLPVLFCDREGRRVAAAHAGWRGLAAGVLQQTLSAFEQPKNVMAYLGPAISQQAFEVGEEVRDCFLALDQSYEDAFVAGASKHKFLCDLYAIARTLLMKQGLAYVGGGDYCTFGDAERFYSYRRDGTRSGRMASLIYLAE